MLRPNPKASWRLAMQREGALFIGSPVDHSPAAPARRPRAGSGASSTGSKRAAALRLATAGEPPPAGRLAAAVGSSAFQALHAAAVLLCVFGPDGLVLARAADDSGARAALNAGLLASAALLGFEWLVLLHAAPARRPLTLACALDGLSVASVVAELSWLRGVASPALARAARTAQMLRFGRLAWQASGLLRRLRRVARRRAAKAGEAEAPSAIAAAICEEVVNKARCGCERAL